MTADETDINGADAGGGSGAAAAAAGPTQTLAAALVNDAAKADPDMAARARALIDEQTEVLRLQKRHVALQIAELDHWSLRVRHIGELLKLAFELAVAFVVLGVVVGLVAMIWSASQAEGLVIRSFDVSADMTQRGLGGPVVASKMLDRLNVMQAATQSSRAASSFSNDWTNDIKVEVPETGVSLGQIIRYLHNVLGNEMHLSGEVSESSAGIALTVRLDDQPGQTFEGKTDDLDKIVQQAAEAVFKRAQPYRYAVYLTGHDVNRVPEAEEVLLALTKQASARERAWAYNGLGSIAARAGHLEEALAYFQRAVTEYPDIPNPYDSLSAVARGITGHAEDSLKYERAYMAELQGRGAREWKADDLASGITLAKGRIAEMIGDYAVALQDYDAVKYSAVADKFRPALVAAFMHDLPQSRARLALLDKADLLPWTRVPAGAALIRALQAIAVDDWRGAIQHLNESEKLATAPEALAFIEGFARAFHAVESGPRLAFAHEMLGERDQADAILKTLPLDCYLCTRMRGKIEAARRNWADAARWFDQAVKQAPSLPFASADWGEMLLDQGDLPAAIAMFSQANEKSPHFADPLELWGEALVRQNHADEALAKFEKANEYAPKWGHLHLKWGEALASLGRKDEALAQFHLAAAAELSTMDQAELAGRMRNGTPRP